MLLDGNGEKDAKKLLTDIACCSVARQLVDHPNPKHPCSKVVGIQKAKSWKAFQVPEPWSGHLLQAPILFLSSNPGISDWDAYPKGVGGFDLWEFFDCRFEGRWSKDCTKALVAGKKSYKTVAYWANIRNRATELLGTKAMCGKDYALSEMVHCKSVMGEGVQSALSTCAELYLTRLLSCSGAVVLVIVGKKALGHWNSLKYFPHVPERDGTRLCEIAGRKRVAVYLPAPAGPEQKTFAAVLSQQKIEQIRDLIS